MYGFVVFVLRLRASCVVLVVVVALVRVGLLLRRSRFLLGVVALVLVGVLLRDGV